MDKSDIWPELPNNRSDLFPCPQGVDGLRNERQLVAELIDFDLIVVSRIEKHLLTVSFQQRPFGESNRILSAKLLIEIMDKEDSHCESWWL